MGWLTWAAIYFTVWWVVLFAMLPIGVRPAEDLESGMQPGAPAQPMLRKKFVWTTIVSAAIVAIAYTVFATGLLDWRELTKPPELLDARP